LISISQKRINVQQNVFIKNQKINPLYLFQVFNDHHQSY